MAYSNKFVACVIVNGQILKELENGVVPIPFGSEYSLRFRNRNDRRAVVQFFVDGENVSSNGYIIGANSVIDIKRHSGVDRAFKFVSLDSDEAADFGKSGPNADKKKGLIEARFYLEKVAPNPQIVDHHHYHHGAPYINPNWGIYTQPTWVGGLGGFTSCNTDTQHSIGSCSGDVTLDFDNSCLRSATPKRSRSFVTPASLRKCGPKLDDGCTVEGASTGQSFAVVSIDVEDTFTTVKMFLQGYDSSQPVQASAPLLIGGNTSWASDSRSKLSKLEAENEELRLKLAELENEKLKKRLARKPRS